MMLCCKYRLYPSEQQESTLLRHIDICRQLYNTLLSKPSQRLGHGRLSAMPPDMKKRHPELDEAYSNALQAVNDQLHRNLSGKAESAGRALVKVNPRGAGREHKHGGLDRDYNASLNILERGLAGLGRPSAPVEIKPLLPVAASQIVEAGSPQPFRGGQFT